jgi:hypothetical protein
LSTLTAARCWPVRRESGWLCHYCARSFGRGVLPVMPTS